MQTTFEMNSKLNLGFGNPYGNIQQRDDAFWEGIVKQWLLCKEELIDEMWEAIENRDIIALADACGDLTVVNDGVAHKAGFDLNRVVAEIDRSNRSKFIANQEEVFQTVNKYRDMGFPEDALRIEGEFPYKCIKVNYDLTVNQKFYPKDKFLKGIGFTDPSLEFILE